VKNGDIQSIWIDGREAARGLGGPLPQDFTAFWIGSRESHGTVPTSPGAIDDLAVLGTALRPDQIEALARGSAPQAVLIDHDADGDGLPDSYELHHRLSVSIPDATADPDDDGLNSLAEVQLMTDPNNPDSDKDGLSDGLEASSQPRSTEALIRDTDQDGLADGHETSTQLRGLTYRSHPLAFDTDGDGFSDGVEAAFACDPADPSSKPMTSNGPVLAAYWDFDAVKDPWKDAVSGATAIPSTTCQHVRGPKGGALRFQGETGLRIPIPQVTQLAAAMNTMVISFWNKRWKPSRGTSVFMESPSSPGAVGLRIHSPWKDGSVIFDTPRNPGFRGSSRGWVPAHAIGFDATAKADQWHHFLFSIHEQKKEIWIDGRCVYQGESGPLPRDLADLWIGGPPGSPGVSGMIDEFAIFLSPLDEDDIERLYQGAKPTAIANEHLAPSY
ncbi:MAG: LamG-like jellyroll fold domain-containing protein, partial [Luteolibacter sp.]